MAFDVTPADGAGPYNFTATIASAMFIDNEEYSISLRSSEAVGSCPAQGTSTPSAAGAAALLTNGVFVTTASVPIGSCRSYTLSIRDIVNDTVISSETVQISNIE